MRFQAETSSVVDIRRRAQAPGPGGVPAAPAPPVRKTGIAPPPNIRAHRHPGEGGARGPLPPHRPPARKRWQRPSRSAAAGPRRGPQRFRIEPPRHRRWVAAAAAPRRHTEPHQPPIRRHRQIGGAHPGPPRPGPAEDRSGSASSPRGTQIDCRARGPLPPIAPRHASDGGAHPGPRRPGPAEDRSGSASSPREDRRRVAAAAAPAPPLLGHSSIAAPQHQRTPAPR